jgi:predicted RNase H-like HicB family nuclease
MKWGVFMSAQFTILIEQGEDGAYIATVPALKSCYTQASTIPELLEKTREVIELCLEVSEEIPPVYKFIGIQQMEVVL